MWGRLTAVMVAIFGLVGCGGGARRIDFHGFKLSVPAGWAATPEGNGIMISRAETSVHVLLQPVANLDEFQRLVHEEVAAQRAAYGADRIEEVAITAVGRLKGHGTKIVRSDPHGALNAETILFVLDGPGQVWMLSTGFSSGSRMVWEEYSAILASASRD